jgi:hypothetical protein
MLIGVFETIWARRVSLSYPHPVVSALGRKLPNRLPEVRVRVARTSSESRRSAYGPERAVAPASEMRPSSPFPLLDALPQTGRSFRTMTPEDATRLNAALNPLGLFQGVLLTASINLHVCGSARQLLRRAAASFCRYGVARPRVGGRSWRVQR